MEERRHSLTSDEFTLRLIAFSILLMSYNELISSCKLIQIMSERGKIQCTIM